MNTRIFNTILEIKTSNFAHSDLYMKNYLYYFEFFSGFYESYFYRDLQASSEKGAFIQIVSFFLNIQEKEAAEHLENELGANWSTADFWEKTSSRFDNESEAYTLIWIKEINFDLQQVGRYT